MEEASGRKSSANKSAGEKWKVAPFCSGKSDIAGPAESSSQGSVKGVSSGKAASPGLSHKNPAVSSGSGSALTGDSTASGSGSSPLTAPITTSTMGAVSEPSPASSRTGSCKATTALGGGAVFGACELLACC